MRQSETPRGWILLLTCATVACGPDTSESALDNDAGVALTADGLGAEREAYQEAAANEVASIELAKVGLRYAEQPSVRHYARSLMREHMDLRARLHGAARRRGGFLPLTDRIDEPWQALPAGPTFDSAFLQPQLELHTRFGLQLDMLAAGTSDGELRAWAVEALDTFQLDQMRADRLQQELCMPTTY